MSVWNDVQTSVRYRRQENTGATCSACTRSLYRRRGVITLFVFFLYTYVEKSHVYLFWHSSHWRCSFLSTIKSATYNIICMQANIDVLEWLIPVVILRIEKQIQKWDGAGRHNYLPQKEYQTRVIRVLYYFSDVSKYEV